MRSRWIKKSRDNLKRGKKVKVTVCFTPNFSQINRWATRSLLSPNRK